MPRRSFNHRLSCRAMAAALFMGLATACLDTGEPTANMPSNPATETFAASLGVNISQMTKKSDALYIQDLVVGTGTEAANGRTLQVTYTGWLVNGTQFDSNVGKATFPLVLPGNVIAGWNLGLVGMKAGGKRRLVIGSDLAYGPSGRAPAIGPNSTLVFDVIVVSVQ